MGENRGVHDLDRIRYTRAYWVDSAVCVDDKGANMRLIDADKLIRCLQNDPLFKFIEKFGVTGVIDAQPTVDAEPVRHGRWEKVRGHQMVRRCSECGDIMPRDRAFIHYIYCGHCGARMDEE